MDKIDTNFSTLSHAVTINERKNLLISGVKKIDSFDNEEFLMETNMGYIDIKGEELEIVKLDTFQGNSLTYMEGPNKKDKDENLFSKLFK